MNSGRRIILAEADARQTALAPDTGAAAGLARGPVGLPDWQQQLAAAVRDPLELLALLGLAPADLGPEVTAAGLVAAARDFPLSVPRGFIARMRHGDPRDPLLRQVLSLPEELRAAPGYIDDPLHEAAMRGAPGLLQKYA